MAKKTYSFAPVYYSRNGSSFSTASDLPSRAFKLNTQYPDLWYQNSQNSIDIRLGSSSNFTVTVTNTSSSSAIYIYCDLMRESSGSWSTVAERTETVAPNSQKVCSFDFSGIDYYNSGGTTIKLHGGTNFAEITAPYWTVEVDYTVTTQVVPVSSPTSGTINAGTNNTFMVGLDVTTVPPISVDVNIASATYYWRAGETGSFTALSMTPSGSTASVTIQAGTFPSGTIQWYAEATDTNGRTTQTPTYTLSTLKHIVDAFPIAPINVLRNAESPIVFSWEYGSVDGSAQSKAEIQTSRDGETWTDLATVAGAATTYTAAAGTFSGGTVYWRVRSYNGDDETVEWAEAAVVSFSVFGAPEIEALTVSGVPFAVISWQVEEQLAYEIEIAPKQNEGYEQYSFETAAGKRYGPYAGATVRSFAMPDPLPDGLNTVRLRAQNHFGLWSSWADAQADIQNYSGETPLEPLELSAEYMNLALILTATDPDPETEAKAVRFYKDGKSIGESGEQGGTAQLVTRTTTGSNLFSALKILPNGHYVPSESASAEESIGCPAIALLSGGEFLLLELSEDANRTQTITKTGEVAYVQYSGSKHPEAEIGEAESLTVTGDVSFTAAQEADARRFEAMLKKAVIYKTPGGEVVVGILQGFTRRDPRFFKSYTFQVTQMERRDFVNA